MKYTALTMIPDRHPVLHTVKTGSFNIHLAPIHLEKDVKFNLENV